MPARPDRAAGSGASRGGRRARPPRAPFRSPRLFARPPLAVPDARGARRRRRSPRRGAAADPDRRAAVPHAGGGDVAARAGRVAARTRRGDGARQGRASRSASPESRADRGHGPRRGASCGGRISRWPSAWTPSSWRSGALPAALPVVCLARVGVGASGGPAADGSRRRDRARSSRSWRRGCAVARAPTGTWPSWIASSARSPVAGGGAWLAGQPAHRRGRADRSRGHARGDDRHRRGGRGHGRDRGELAGRGAGRAAGARAAAASGLCPACRPRGGPRAPAGSRGLLRQCPARCSGRRTSWTWPPASPFPFSSCSSANQRMTRRRRRSDASTPGGAGWWRGCAMR